jgi:hypothetical protein
MAKKSLIFSDDTPQIFENEALLAEELQISD